VKRASGADIDLETKSRGWVANSASPEHHRNSESVESRVIKPSFAQFCCLEQRAHHVGHGGELPEWSSEYSLVVNRHPHGYAESPLGLVGGRSEQAATEVTSPAEQERTRNALPKCQLHISHKPCSRHPAKVAGFNHRLRQPEKAARRSHVGRQRQPSANALCVSSDDVGRDGLPLSRTGKQHVIHAVAGEARGER